MQGLLNWARAGAVVLTLLGLAGTAGASAEDPQAVFAAARAAATDGPADVPLSNQAVLKLPAGHFFIGAPHATRVLNAMGNPGEDPRLQGLVFPTEGDWFMTVRFEAAGYVKDDDARDWNADDLLTSYREGTDEANKEREKLGIAPLEIVGWAEKPAYDASTHRLVWAMSSREKGAPAAEALGVNYNTYALGREGYFSMNLVTGLDRLPADKPSAHALLAALEYNEGKRYGDFNASTDKVAEYGLAALVAGAAAKKLGFFALIAAFFAKFAKVIILAVVAFGGLIAKAFRGRRTEPAATATDSAPDKD